MNIVRRVFGNARVLRKWQFRSTSSFGPKRHRQLEDEEPVSAIPPPPLAARRKSGAFNFLKQRTLSRPVRRLYPHWVSRRQFSGTPIDPTLNLGAMGVEQIKEILSRDRYREVVDAISLDTRVRISPTEFDKIALEFGVQPGETEELRGMLTKTGIILDFSKDFNTIIIKPERVLRSWEKAFDLTHANTSRFIKRRQEELTKLQEKLAPLEEQHQDIEKLAERSSIWWMRGLFGYTLVHSWLIVYLTFWLLSWDIMEPITYLINLFSFITAVYFFNSTNCDFTFDAMKATMRAIKRKKLYKQRKFDVVEYERIKKAIFDAEQDLHNPEWFVLNEISNEMHGAKLPDPEKFEEEQAVAGA